MAEALKVAGTARFASVTPPEGKPLAPVFMAILFAIVFPGILVFAALYLVFQSLMEPIGALRWVIAAAVVIAVVFVSGIVGKVVWRRLRLPGRGPEDFLPVRWLIHRRATARVKRLVAELAVGDTYDPLTAIKQLAVALEKRDLYTRIHSGRVSRLAYQIAEHLDRPGWEREQVRMAGLLHDLGKLEIPDSILYKPEPLDHREERIMRTHPILSAELIGPFIDPVVVDAVLHHHERVDGGGYPTGVLLCDRDLLCKVIPVCDTYDTLISDRPYRAGRAKEAAWEELRAVAGTQLDADLVEALIEVEKEKTKVPAAAAAIFLPFGSVFRKMSHVFHTSTAPAAAAVASVVAAAAVATGPSPLETSLSQYSAPPAQSSTAPAVVEDEVPPVDLTPEEVVNAKQRGSGGFNDQDVTDKRVPTPQAPTSPTAQPPRQPSEQACKLPVTGTEFPTLPAVGCPFTAVPPR